VKGTSGAEERTYLRFEYKALRVESGTLFLRTLFSRLGDHGSRVQGGRAFGTEENTHPDQIAEEEDENLVLDIDEDDVVWSDMVDDGPEVEELGDLALR